MLRDQRGKTVKHPVKDSYEDLTAIEFDMAVAYWAALVEEKVTSRRDSILQALARVVDFARQAYPDATWRLEPPQFNVGVNLVFETNVPRKDFFELIGELRPLLGDSGLTISILSY